MHISKIHFIVLLSCLVFCSCQINQDRDGQPEKTETSIRQVEKDFEKMASEKGIAEAFWFYADSNAVIKRQNDTLIHGKEAIKSYYSNDYYKTASVKWWPDFIESSSDGSMAYTYGNYTWHFKDSSGKVNESNGVFHTVWKKQKDGSWKYDWD